MKWKIGNQVSDFVLGVPVLRDDLRVGVFGRGGFEGWFGGGEESVGLHEGVEGYH